MRAVVIDAFGGPEVLQVKELALASPGPGEVMVRVIASGTNPVEAKLRKNGSWAGLKPPVVLGYDASGVVEEVGPGVTDFAVGDEVFYTPEIFGNPQGTHAERHVAPVRLVARKPAGLSHEEAAAIPLAGGTAWEAIVRRLAVRVGETVLIHGGAGGVGSFAVQFAKVAGARGLATASADNLRALGELGADAAFDYKKENVVEAVLRETGGRGADAVFDTAGGNLVQSFPATRPFGRLATILGFQGDCTQAYVRNLTVHGVFLTRERKRLEEMTPLFERKQVRPVLDAVLPLADVRKAHERLDSGHGRGKIVLSLRGDRAP
jgi:NADPH2:quinone reductase